MMLPGLVSHPASSCCAGLLAAAAGSFSFAAEPITFESLLEEMVDRAAPARFPDPAYTCRQFSSYDRNASDPSDKSTWYANHDRTNFLRAEEIDGRIEHVLMDADGPGAVVRFWSTWAVAGGGEFSNGTLRVYLDHDGSPAIEGPIADLLDGGALVGPPLSQGVSPLTEYRHRGHNLYLPVPYAEHCRITYETKGELDDEDGEKEGLYYQICYRTYEMGTDLRSFRMTDLKRSLARIARTQKSLLRPGDDLDPATGSAAAGGRLDPGQDRTLVASGPAAVREITVRLDAADLPQALRSTVLEIKFDGQRTVWCPVGDFFGTGYYFSPHKTWYTNITPDGCMSCYWIMPFAEECSVSLHNLGPESVEIALMEVVYADWDWDDRSMYFHTTWRELTGVATATNAGALAGAFDVNYVSVDGRGVYVGDVLTLFNGGTIWWGEGDEKIFVDGEDFPSHFGTGTEDYYGYAWGNPNFFQAPFHAQPYGKGANSSDLVVNLRYRALDAIPFEKSLDFYMELWHWQATKVNYAPATFFYASPGAVVNVQPDPKAAALPVARKRTDVVNVFHAPGAIECEALPVHSRTGGETEIQASISHNWSDEKQLWWYDAAPGDVLNLAFPGEDAGRFRVFICLTKAEDYGIVRISINGRDSGRTYDRYFTSVRHDEIDLGVFSLNEGDNTLAIEIAGANENAIKRHMVGLDYLRLEKAD